jgi:hypothetical protein
MIKSENVQKTRMGELGSVNGGRILSFVDIDAENEMQYGYHLTLPYYI